MCWDLRSDVEVVGAEETDDGAEEGPNTEGAARETGDY